MNRLGRESSPYLLQHRDNPVAWYPWSEEAFAEARSRDVPIFLSIGYATCHWCHVMEHESFEDEEVAALLNESFVSIKVDREERPDIDQVYMTVCQIMGGSCGWPLTVIMTPDALPFFVATYIPRETRFGRIGMLDLIPRIARAWDDDRENVEKSARHVTSALRRMEATGRADGEVDTAWLKTAFEQLAARYDPEYGGFGGAPKFPAPHNLLFLLRHWYRERNPAALQIVVSTLRAMRRGGIFDQLGWGFHRYSTDREWRLPHFEKMLYDQALHVMAYTEAFLATAEPDLADVAREVADYVLRDLRSEAGAFFSAEDADSEGEEGKFYVWSLDEVRDALPPEQADYVIGWFGLRAEGNYLEEATREPAGTNVLHRSARAEGVPNTELLREATRAMFEYRRRREPPLLDDKILTDWNGLMIAALSMLGTAVGEPRYVGAARTAAEFVWDRLRDGRGRLLHRFRAGVAGIGGTLLDYACLTWGLIELYQATHDATQLVRASRTATEMIERFWDEADGGFFMAAGDGEALVARLKDYDDAAMPSGNSIALLCLLRLARLTGSTDYDRVAYRLLEAASARVARYPSAYSGLLMGLEFMEAGPAEVVVAGPPGSSAARDMVRALHRRYLPSTVSVVIGENRADLERAAPFTASFEVDREAAVAYVCRDHVCGRPSGTVTEMLEALGFDRRAEAKEN